MDDIVVSPCPFCGKPPTVTPTDGGHEDGVTRGWRIACRYGPCFVNPFMGVLANYRRVVELWNIRDVPETVEPSFQYWWVMGTAVYLDPGTQRTESMEIERWVYALRDEAPDRALFLQELDVWGDGANLLDWVSDVVVLEHKPKGN